MRKTVITLATTAGILGFGTVGASALPAGPMQGSHQVRPTEGALIQKADWYCGPRCQYWHHRRWEQRHYDRYGYNGYYGYNRGYNGYYR